ncbi:DUF4156 domain-containing protein [Desulfurivibrio sp. C05AmB]|jgi:hypothetical protein|uniref:DUF4156 domain-containing protein n=1 Tax=Desulfurivibrio sp. C05AmB TaxID=3374371 RepID=UPI00376F0E04
MRLALTAGVVIAAVLLLGACTWVKPTVQGEKVRVLTAEEVVKCERVGQTTVSLLARVAGIERSPRKVQEELNVLARNSAADVGGDTVVPMGPVEDGKQTFAIYRCMPR